MNSNDEHIGIALHSELYCLGCYFLSLFLHLSFTCYLPHFLPQPPSFLLSLLPFTSAYEHLLCTTHVYKSNQDRH